MQPKIYDVVVAGGGPVGLFTATELRRYGLRVAVVERLTEPSRQIKAGSVGPDSAAVLDQRGLRDAFPVPDWAAFVGKGPGGTGRPVGHFAGLWVLRGAPGVVAMPIFAPQHLLETVLDEHARHQGVTLLRGHEVLAYDDAGSDVRVSVAGPEGEETLTAAYLIGADGGRSRVRKAAGLPFDGTDATITGRQALVDIAEPNPLDKGWHRTEHGMVVFGPDPRRVLTVEFDGPPADRTAPVTADEIQASLRRVSGRDVTVTALHTGTRWTDNTRVARDYRAGRVLLAGDAAHVHPPFGGQGLNLGLQDAANLGWKLAAVHQGWASAALLETYTAERKPVAEAALANTRAQVALMRPDPQTSALRELMTTLLDFDEANAYVSALMSGMERRLQMPGGNDEPGVGAIVADADIAGTRLYELLRTPGWLLVDTTGDGDLGASVEVLIDRVRVVHDPQGGRSMLVRPDGILAWASGNPTPADAGFQATLAAWFGLDRVPG